MAVPVIRFHPWSKNASPKKILVMRFQAIGDMVITLPYLQDLKNQHPHTEMHFLTRKETSAIPKQLTMFTRVIEIGGGRNAKVQFMICLMLLPYLWLQHYDVVLDLQHHKISRIIRRLLFTRVWSEFDRSSPISAGERTRATIHAVGIGSVTIAEALNFRNILPVELKMKLSGWNGTSEIILLNPAGAFQTRAWPLQNYIDFAVHWLEKDNRIQFLVLGLPSISWKAELFKAKLGARLIDMTGKTNLVEAFTIVRSARLILSEDSGLMHMAWTQHVPVLAIFGSTRNDWSAPLGEWSLCLNSSDLPCGNCMLETCKFNDNHCLTRFTPRLVFDESVRLLDSLGKSKRNDQMIRPSVEREG